MNKHIKILLTFFVLFFSSSVVAEDISDYQIEQMSVGDSLLDFYSKSVIKKNFDTTTNNIHKDKTFYSISIEDEKFKIYDIVQFYLKTNDENYIIYSIAGAIFFDSDISKCYSRKDSIVKEISKTLKNTKKTDYGTYPDDSDPSGKSLSNSVYFDFQDDQGEGMDYIAVACSDWSEEFEQSYNFIDNLRVIIANKEYDYWINNLAY